MASLRRARPPFRVRRFWSRGLSDLFLERAVWAGVFAVSRTNLRQVATRRSSLPASAGADG